jgi:hypothetical protein
MRLDRSLSPYGVWSRRWLRLNEWWCIRNAARALEERDRCLRVPDLDAAAYWLNVSRWWTDRLKEFTAISESLKKEENREKPKAVEHVHLMAG